MPSFGEKLRLEREKRKISLEQISSTTKIGTRMLQALEEDKFNQLPGGIFNKGFVRAYARVVGLDEDQAVADYLQASGDGSAARPELVTRDSMPRDAASRDAARDEDNRISRLEAISDEPSRRLPWGLFAVILLIIALLLSLWSRQRREQERKAVRPLPTKVIAPNTGAPSPGRAGLGAAVPEAGSLSTGGPRSTTPGEIAKVAAGSSSLTSSLSSSLTSGAAPVLSGVFVRSSRSGVLTPTSAPVRQNSNAGVAVPASGEFLIVVHAREESWVSVSVDGKFSGSEMLEPGSRRAFRAHKDVFVKAGSAGALDFLLDGKKLDVGGHIGEVKSVTIGHAGLIASTSPPPTNP